MLSVTNIQQRCLGLFQCAMLVFGLHISALVYADMEMYRYTNAQGVQVIARTIPPEYAQKGYEVIDHLGNVLDVVKPSLAPEEIAAEQQRIEREQQLMAWDRDLLSRYSAVVDVEAAKKRRLAEIENSIAILKGNVHQLDSQLAREEGKAARLERSNQPVPESILTNIANFKKERQAAEKLISARQDDYQEMAEKYNRDIERFQFIQDRISAHKSRK